MTTVPLPAPYNRAFLLEHCHSILNFYDPRVIDNEGGYFHNYLNNGDLFEKGMRQLVSSCRIVVNYARASRELHKAEYRDVALHGLAFVEQVHWRPDHQAYAWLLEDHNPLDMTQQNYGYAFVLLMYSAIHKAGIRDVADKIAATYQLMESRFWQSDYELYADELSADGVLSDYRGQNANMHSCEAMIAAYEATHELRYLRRAKLIAQNITERQAAYTDGLIWEHYTPDFKVDWDYNLDDPKNLYRPWGFQPGHQTEWSKLLLAIHRLSPDQALVTKATFLFDKAFDVAWDHQHGGLIYGFDPQGKWCDDDKYFWVQAESFAAAAMLYQETGDNKYKVAYEQLWQYSWTHMIDHEYGAWFRLLTRDNKAYSNQKSSAGAKCDYHTLCACFDVLTGMV